MVASEGRVRSRGAPPGVALLVLLVGSGAILSGVPWAQIAGLGLILVGAALPFVPLGRAPSAPAKRESPGMESTETGEINTLLSRRGLVGRALAPGMLATLATGRWWRLGMGAEAMPPEIQDAYDRFMELANSVLVDRYAIESFEPLADSMGDVPLEVRKRLVGPVPAPLQVPGVSFSGNFRAFATQTLVGTDDPKQLGSAASAWGNLSLVRVVWLFSEDESVGEVRAEEVQYLADWRRALPSKRAVLVTNGILGTDASELARQLDVDMIDRQQLDDLLHEPRAHH